MDSAWYKSSIKAKILIGFGSAIIILVIAGIISFRSFKDLMRSLDFLSKPEIKLIKYNDLLSDLSLSESSMRSYFISNEKKYLDRYDIYSFQIEKNIDSLNLLIQDAGSNSDKIKRISSLWNEKKKHTQELITLYKNKQDKKIPDGIISKLNRDIPDVPTLIITKTITIKNKEVLKENTDTIDDKETEEKRSLLTRLFKKKDKQEAKKETYDSLDPIIKKEITTFVDTIYTDSDVSEIREEKFTQILTNIRQHNSKSTQKLKNHENEIIQKDIGLIEYIRNIIIELKNSEQEKTEAQIKEAKKIIELSLMKLFLFGLSGISAILAFGFVILSDVNKTNYQKTQLLQAKIQAEELVKAKESFLANMSHEIRTPLNSIVGFTEQLSQTQLLNKQKYYLQAVTNSSSHLLSLVNDILDHSRIEAGKIDFEETDFSLKEIMEEVINVFHLKASEKTLTLTYHINGNESQSIIGDPLRLKQVLFNLVSNAIKFTEKGTVAIQCELLPLSEHEFSLIISVTDTGIGIPSDKLDKIFETFTQADSGISRKFGGTGLGLAISKKLVELQGGRIVVKSTEGIGSEFTFCIKYKKNKTLNSLDKENDSINLDLLDKMKILVVEDDEFNLLLFHTILIKWNCYVSMAGNGEEAIQYLNKEKFDIVITDIHMPGISGVDLFKWIKSNSISEISNTPVLAVTANVIKESMKVYKDSGFNGILLKPFKEEELAKAILTLTNPNQQFSEDWEEEEIKEETTDLFSDFMKFSGGNSEVAAEIINAFIKNNYNLLEQVNTSFIGQDWALLKDSIHKLNPGFGHIRNSEMTSLLSEVELYLEEENNPSHEKLKDKIHTILETGYEQMKEVEEQKEKWNV